MLMHAGSWSNFVRLRGRSSLAALALCLITVLLPGCSRELRVHKGEEMHMGPFTLRVSSVDSYSREHQGVPWEVAVQMECKGGNRFERLDFAERLSRQGRIHFSNAEGYRERVWMLRRGEDVEDFMIHANPPADSKAMTLEIRNSPARKGEPGRYLIDLGR